MNITEGPWQNYFQVGQLYVSQSQVKSTGRLWRADRTEARDIADLQSPDQRRDRTDSGTVLRCFSLSTSNGSRSSDWNRAERYHSSDKDRELIGRDLRR